MEGCRTTRASSRSRVGNEAAGTRTAGTTSDGSGRNTADSVGTADCPSPSDVAFDDPPSDVAHHQGSGGADSDDDESEETTSQSNEQCPHCSKVIHGNDHRIAGIARVQCWDHSPSQDDMGGHWPAVRTQDPAGRPGGGKGEVLVYISGKRQALSLSLSLSLSGKLNLST